jgi:hypothetical protein
VSSVMSASINAFHSLFDELLDVTVMCRANHLS